MKKIFALAMVSMAAVMTSCGNDDADFIEQKAPAPAPVSISITEKSFDESKPDPEFDGNIYFAAFEQQNDYINSEYTIQVGSESETVNIVNLPVANTLPLNVEIFFERCGRKEGFVRPTVYVYQIPAGMTGKVNVTANLSVKEGVELPASLTVMGGAATSVENQLVGYPDIVPAQMANTLNRFNTQNYAGDVTK